jgi:4-hydroxy-tetrahydrodipicolinate reductase
MNIGIIGHGKMGHEVESRANAENIGIAAVIDPDDRDATSKEITAKSMEHVDVAIDFSTPSSVLTNVERLAALHKNVVVGTTGWYENMDRIKALVKKEKIGLIYSPNFSVGVNLFFQIVKRAAVLVDKFPGYDPYVYEIHHNQKTDAPGGTARVLGNIIIDNVKRKKKMVFERVADRKIAPEELHVASIRAGYIPGIHVVGFDGAADTIELTHTARSRAGFAEGALMAAKWIHGKKGFYSMEDFIASVAGE